MIHDSHVNRRLKSNQESKIKNQKSMRAILLTSTFRRHVFVANTVAAGCDLVGVWQEEKSFRLERYANGPDDEAVIQRHFADRDASEAQYFADDDRVRL